mgnify:FL=1
MELYFRLEDYDSSDSFAVFDFNNCEDQDCSSEADDNIVLMQYNHQISLNTYVDEVHEGLLTGSYDTQTWMHLIVGFTSSKAVIYKNGKYISSASINVPSSQSMTSNFIGRTTLSGGGEIPNFKGTIRHLRIYPSLTDADVKDIYRPYNYPHHVWDFRSCNAFTSAVLDTGGYTLMTSGLDPQQKGLRNSLTRSGTEESSQCIANQGITFNGYPSAYFGSENKFVFGHELSIEFYILLEPTQQPPSIFGDPSSSQFFQFNEYTVLGGTTDVLKFYAEGNYGMIMTSFNSQVDYATQTASGGESVRGAKRRAEKA